MPADSKSSNTSRDSKENETRLKKILSEKQMPSLLLLISPDGLRRERLATKLLQHFSAEKVKFDCESLNENKLRQIKDDLLNVALFAKPRFFIFNYPEKLKVNLADLLIEALKVQSETIKIILNCEKLPASGAIYKYCKSNAEIFELAELKGFDLRRWAEKEIKSAGIKDFEQTALDNIISIGDSNPDQIAKIIDQVTIYIDQEKLTTENLHELFSASPNSSEFNLVDAITAKKYGNSEILLSQILESGKNPFALLSLLTKTFSSYLLIRSMQSKGIAAPDIRQTMGVSPWLFNKYNDAARGYSQDQLLICLKSILRAEARLKNRSLGAESIFSELIDCLAA